MQIFALKIPSTATAITLLPPLKILYHSVLYTLVAVVAVKFTIYII